MANTTAYPPIADYGLIGDMHSCALVSKAGSVDWCCFPRFDSPAVFSRLLDWDSGGCFEIAPMGVKTTHRRYLPDTTILETTFITDTGTARLTDFMPVQSKSQALEPREVCAWQQIVRILECIHGSVEYRLACRPRFDYGTIVPHAHLSSPNTGIAHGGGDALAIYCSVPLETVDDSFEAQGLLRQGERICTAVTYESRITHASEIMDEGELARRLQETTEFWRQWAALCTYDGPYRDEVVRSALTLKALSYAPSGALLAAATTSLPEVIGGSRNWDYRYTWIRDAAFALYALAIIGYHEEASYFKDWLEWSTAGRARDLQIMYGITGERRLTEVEIPSLEGYRGSRPVRIGNGAHGQFQLDIYGELLDSAHLYRKFGGEIDREYWAFLQRVVAFVIDHWREPDNGIWETRGGAQHFVFSKVMCWVALDRAIKAAVALQLPADLDRWREVRSTIREDILAHGYNAERGAFVQAYGSQAVDASALMLPLVRFVNASDPRMSGTLAAIERDLVSPQGLVRRYTDSNDGLAESEGAFKMCTFWLADNYVMRGELDRARVLLERLRNASNDLGLYSEQIDLDTGELLGNFPQAFSHLAFISTAVQLANALKQRAAAAPQ